ncbi:hypothetical protein BZL30_4574 [Mycobacterium kansasii]|uniref:Uncharacterized protein n=1 Tax=Mycobacterium kansasii TaxID=1768 RepID=A0A1V3X327_MYCKA|nr:hypothetical protein BZL30_4574 [Mycobacterium kansasii]
MGAGPLPHMMDLATITRHVATRRRAPTILGIQDNSLPGRGQAFGVIQSQRFAVVEDSEVMIRVAASRITSDIGSRVPPPVRALPDADSSSLSVVDTMMLAGNPLC